MNPQTEFGSVATGQAHTIDCLLQMRTQRLKREEWLRKWGRCYCRTCQGQGVTVKAYSFIDPLTGKTEEAYDAPDCGECITEDLCPRCGLETPDLHIDWLCPECGWDCSLGVPGEPACTCDAHGPVGLLDTPIGVLLAETEAKAVRA